MSTRKSLDSLLEERERSENFSGVVRITRGEEELFAGSYGPASRAWMVSNTLDTRFDTASITKLFTALVVLQQVELGRLRLDTRVSEILDLEGTAISPEVSVFHLLTHSSGIGDDSEEEDGERYEDIWKERSCYAVRETADFLPQFVHKPANFAPGERCRYNNCAFVLLGLAVEKLTGRSYRDIVREDVFARVGMRDSGFFAMDEVQPRVAEGADPVKDSSGAVVGWKRNMYSFPPIGSPDSGAQVTAADLDRFLRALLGGALLSEQLSEAFFTPQVRDREVEGGVRHYGFGMEYLVDTGGEVVYGEKGGCNAGVSGAIRRYPDRDLHVVILSNLENGAWEPLRRIHELVLDGRFDS